jgi:hypothetical protein
MLGLEGIVMVADRQFGGVLPLSARLGRQNKVLLGLLLFNGVSAVGGGIALMTGWIPEQDSWIRHTDFPSNYFPGVILMALVGGTSLIAAIALVKGSDGRQLAGIVAGTVMVFWIIGELASIRGFHVLQVIYLVTGALVVMLTPGRTTDALQGAHMQSPADQIFLRPLELADLAIYVSWARDRRFCEHGWAGSWRGSGSSTGSAYCGFRRFGPRRWMRIGRRCGFSRRSG